MYYVVAVVSCVLVLLYKYFKSSHDYWEKRNVPFQSPNIFFGNLTDSVLMKRSLGPIYTDIYNNFKDAPYVGFFKIRKPSILIRDPEIIKDVLMKDFHYFEKNDAFIDEEVDPIATKNPFLQHGERWKISRSQMSYCFSSGKMKHMFTLMEAVAQDMLKYIESEVKIGGNPIEVKKLSEKFTSDNVATCAFGLDGKAFEDPNPEFVRVGKQIFQPSFTLAIKVLILVLFPELGKVLKVRFIPTNVAEYFTNVVRDTLEYRKKNNIVRNDFLDVIMQIKNKPGEPPLTDEDVVAKAISFFSDGFETSSIALSFTLYDLAANQDVQEKLRNEVHEVLKKYGGKICYEAIQDMNYLDCVFSESLRLHPAVLFQAKLCTADYNFPPCNPSGKEVKIEKETPIMISTMGLHLDPNHFPEPNKFDPERFSDDNKSKIVKGAYLPFGEGLRKCIGMKFAVLQIKVAIVAIIKTFDLKVNKKTKEPLEYDEKHFLLLSKDGLWLDFYKRNN